MINDDIKLLKQKIKTSLPQYSCAETLLHQLNALGNISINTQWIENLFLLQGAHWDVVGEALSVLKITRLDISACNFNVRIGGIVHVMDWENFSRMLSNTYISELKTGQELPPAYQDPIMRTLEANSKKPLTCLADNLVSISMKNILAYGIWYKNKIPTEIEQKLDDLALEIKRPATLN